MKKVLLAGYYGFGNIGDEAILEMILKQLSEIVELENVTVLSGNPKITTKKYSIKSIYRFNILALLKAILDNELLVIGGGSLLQDITSKRSIYYYLFIIKLSQIFNKNTIMLSQGIGPITNKYNRIITGKILKQVDYISVRDLNSKKIIEEMGVNKSKIFFSADPVIKYESKTNIMMNTVDKRKKICFSLRKWKESENIDSICNVIDKLNSDEFLCYFLPLHYGEDMELIYEFEKKLGDKCIYLKDKLSAKEIFSIISNMDLLVGIRLHSLVFAASANIPFIAISYDPKIDFFLDNLNMKVLCSIENIKDDLLYNEIINKINNIKDEKSILIKNVNKLKQTTNVNVDILKKII